MAAWYNGIQSSILSVIHYSSQENWIFSAKFSLGFSAYQGNTSRIFVLHNWLSVGPYSNGNRRTVGLPS